jgi:RND family efflux transporter MFP subunit
MPRPRKARLRLRGRSALSNAAWLVVTSLLLALSGWWPATAHEGHDHGAPVARASAEAAPRASAQSESYELVAVLKGEALLVYLDHFEDNRPVGDAALEITIADKTLAAERLPDAVYRVPAPGLARPGKHELIFTVKGGPGDDLLIATLEVPAAVPSAKAAPAAGPGNGKGPSTTMLLVIGGIGISIMAIAASMMRGSVARAALIGLIALAGVLLLGIVPLPAHEGHDHGAPAKANFSQTLTGDSPQRLPDGAVFLPKPSQRLLEVRTAIARTSSQRPALTLVGRVIPDPNASGFVQSTIGGRITPTANGLPRLGQAVQAGDVLGYVQPPFAAIDQTQIAQTAGELDQQIALAQNKLERARRLVASNAGTKVAVEEAEIQLKGLEKRRSALRVSQAAPEPLVAPVAGVIAGARAVPGQVVSPPDVLFQIVDPARLWVEAYAFDPALASDLAGAKGMAQNGAAFALAFIGRSRTLQQQSAILHFRIATPPATLNVGMPVQVLAEAGESVEGLILPKAAVVRAANGEAQVWLHTEPERFVARAVRVGSFDGERVVVLAGLKGGERVVVDGAELVNQVR